MLHTKQLNELLNKVAFLIEEYHELSWNSGGKLSEILKDLTATLFYLEKYRSEYHQEYNSILYNHKGSVASGKILADEKIPELYLLRRIMTGAYRTVDAIRSNISYIKKEA